MDSNTYRVIHRVSVIAIIILASIIVNTVLDSNIKITAADISQESVYQNQRGNSMEESIKQAEYNAGEDYYTSEPAEEEYFASDIPDEEIKIAEIINGIQEVTVNVSEYRFSPSIIVLQKGIKAKMKFNPVFLDECNEIIAFPEQGFVLGLYKGQLETEMLDIERDFIFECWMGMINGYVKVVDDINNIDINVIKNEVIYYEPSGGESCH